MRFETSIYGEVDVPVKPEGLNDLRGVRRTCPNLRVEVTRGNLRFMIPLSCLLIGDEEPAMGHYWQPLEENLEGLRFE